MPKTKSKKEKTSKKSLRPKITYKLSDKFTKDYRKASEEIQTDVNNILELIDRSGKFTTGMRPRKLKGTTNIWYLKIGEGSRVTFTKLPDNKIFLRRCGPHEILKKESKKKK